MKPMRTLDTETDQLAATAPPHSDPNRLGVVSALAYALPAAPLAALAFALQVLVPPLYADTIGLGLGMTAAMLLIARIFDIGSDFVIGYLSDRYAMPLGKRRFWMLLGAPLSAIAAWLLFNPSEGAGPAYLLLWTLALYIGGTMVVVPFNAWGADLAVDYNDRTRVTAWRVGGGMTGILILLMALAFAGDATGEAGPAGTIALIGGPLLILAVTLACARLPDRARVVGARPTSKGLFRDVLGERSYRQFYIAFVINGVANGVPASLFILYVEHVLELPQSVGLYLLLYFGAALASAGVWRAVSRRIEKDQLWRISLVMAVLSFAGVLVLGPGDGLAFGVICLLSGIAFGADIILPGSITADLAKHEEQRHGREQAAGFFAVLGSFTKLGSAVAIGLALPIVGLLGFDTAVDESPTWGLTVTYGLIPILLKIWVTWQLWKHPPPKVD